MTAEIAIMNKMAVALAADSAVTIRSAGRLKIYNTNKLFMLSKYEPVGIMLFSDAEMMRIPWESIIKSYRQDLETTTFGTLEEYGQHFIAHLSSATSLFPEQEQQRWLSQLIYRFLKKRRDEIDTEVEALTHRQKKGINDNQVKRIATRLIKARHDQLEGFSPLATVPVQFGQHVLKKHGTFN